MINTVKKLLRRAKYNTYDTREWVKAYFDENSGGFMVYHKDHQFDPTIGKFGIPRGEYEKIVSEVLVRYGMIVELGSEKAPHRIKVQDGLLDGIKFEIKSIEGVGKNNIINNLKVASKKGAEAVVLYYHDNGLFLERQIQENYQSYLRNSKSRRIQKIYYIVNGELHTLK